MLAFAKNLGVKTKKIDAFKLTAQIAEADGKKYGFPLGFREGVHLDDGFDLVEYSEDEEGNEIAERVGFVRVIKTGNFPSAFTYGKQLLGDRQDIGGVVMEHPTLGMDIKVKAGMITGLSIGKDKVPAGLFGADPLFSEDITSGAGVDITIGYNVAPIIGISQTFLDANVAFAFPVGTLNPDLAEVPTVAPFLLSVYGGATKKIWFGSSNLGLGGGLGMESLNLKGTLLSEDYQYSIMALAFKFGADFEKMITPDLNVNLGLTYKMAMAPSALMITWGSYEMEYTSADPYWDSLALGDIGLGGMAFSIGANYALGELPINLFGFLDPFKKH
jgi:hypothetical protein